jgi:hypothetical protein
MRRLILICIALQLAAASVAHAFTDEEHRHLALDVFEKLAALDNLDITISPEALAEICVRSSQDDLAPSRYQVRGLTPYQQAAVITPEEIEEIVTSIIDDPPTEQVFRPYADNVVANYIVYHSIAIACAQRSRGDWAHVRRHTVLARSEWLEHALVFEAVALGYLADAFSSSHILTPVHLPLSVWQGANVRAAHEFFATQGAYVLARGQVWQTFGDGLLEWYSGAHERVVKEYEDSVSDLLLTRANPVWDQASIWEAARRIPCVVVASWRPPRGPANLQFREDGLHDPDLHADRRFLYSQEAVLSGPWGLAGPDPDYVTSVEYHQTLDYPPVFTGLLLMTGGGVLVKDDGGGAVGSVAAGYAWAAPVPLLKQVRTSVELEYVYRLGDPDRRVIVPRYAVGLGSPIVPGVEAMHFEVGYAWGLYDRFKDQGVKWGVGIGTKPLRLPFTYAGVSARLKYERFWIEDGLDGFQLQLIFR